MLMKGRSSRAYVPKAGLGKPVRGRCHQVSIQTQCYFQYYGYRASIAILLKKPIENIEKSYRHITANYTFYGHESKIIKSL